MLVTNGESRRLLEIIQAQGEIAAGELDQDRAMQVIVDRVPELIGADGALIDSPDGDRLVFRAGSGVDPEVIGWQYPRVASLSGLALERRSVLISRNTWVDRRVESGTCRRLRARSLLCAPLVHHEQELGTLTAFSIRPYAFDQKDSEAIGLLGRSLSAHLHHAAGFTVASHLSLHDHLTGLQNRRAYEMRLKTETTKAKQHGRELSLCLLDLDSFKQVNDRFGHVAGDEVLRVVARGFDSRRLSDDAFRIGGDEFAVIFPDCGTAGARTAIRRMVDELDLGSLTARGISFGVSFGIAAGETDPKALHAAADQQLAAAKRLRHLKRLPNLKRDAASPESPARGEDRARAEEEARADDAARGDEAARSRPTSEAAARSASA
ncbi:MAG TPA: sensor domain-containing diguanylate cyclase [Solirubrobacterales bacterium]|jgi:diguanylate cyclase (GGDEF)-like protein